MMVMALGVLFSVSLAIGAAVPIGALEIATGKSAFRTVKVSAAATGSLTEIMETAWVDSLRARPVGWRDSVGPGQVEQVGPGLWLVSVEAVLRDRAGRALAQAHRGWLVQDGAVLGDSANRPILIRRYRVHGFQ